MEDKFRIIYADPPWPFSSKPFETRLRIERLFGDVPRLELFARFKAPGRDVWGNEVESDIAMEVGS